MRFWQGKNSVSHFDSSYNQADRRYKIGKLMPEYTYMQYYQLKSQNRKNGITTFWKNVP